MLSEGSCTADSLIYLLTEPSCRRPNFLSLLSSRIILIKLRLFSVPVDFVLQRRKSRFRFCVVKMSYYFRMNGKLSLLVQNRECKESQILFSKIRPFRFFSDFCPDEKLDVFLSDELQTVFVRNSHFYIRHSCCSRFLKHVGP